MNWLFVFRPAVTKLRPQDRMSPQRYSLKTTNRYFKFSAFFSYTIELTVKSGFNHQIAIVDIYFLLQMKTSMISNKQSDKFIDER